jgi:acyl-CoA synthetase (AMP-forming)/AMP-acid ligase II
VGASCFVGVQVGPAVVPTVHPVALPPLAANAHGGSGGVQVGAVVVLEALPRTATNKVMRRVLRDQALASRRAPQSRL